MAMVNPMRELLRVVAGDTETHRELRGRVGAIVTITLVVDVIGTLLVLHFEHGAPNSQVTNLGDALFWTTAQLLTVSSQLSAPLTTGGRIVDVFLEMYAVAVVATLAGAWGSFFHRRSHERRPMSPPV
jgi:hypothetical protein